MLVGLESERGVLGGELLGGAVLAEGVLGIGES